MKPELFNGANDTLNGGPVEAYGTDDRVVDLPVYRDGEVILSCWRMSWRERLRALLDGRVWLWVHAPRTHAPVKLTMGDPFEKRGEGD